MQICLPYPHIRDDRDYDVSMNRGNGDPFAVIEMGDGTDVSFNVSRQDAQRLLNAAGAVVAMFAGLDTPHDPQPGGGPHGAHCKTCGLLVHRHPVQPYEPSGSPSGAAHKGSLSVPACGAITMEGPFAGYGCNSRAGHGGPVHTIWSENGDVRHTWPVDGSKGSRDSSQRAKSIRPGVGM